MICPSGFSRTITLGNEPDKQEMFKYPVPARCWFAATPAAGTVFSFTSCTMAPGFDVEDFELAGRQQLISLYPQHT